MIISVMFDVVPYIIGLFGSTPTAGTFGTPSFGSTPATGGGLFGGGTSSGTSLFGNKTTQSSGGFITSVFLLFSLLLQKNVGRV